MAQDITQCCFRHLIQRDIEIGSNVLYAFVDLMLSLTPEVFATEITLFKCGVRRDFSSQIPFIQCHADNSANLMTFHMQERVFRVSSLLYAGAI